jgi:hypothetical protein
MKSKTNALATTIEAPRMMAKPSDMKFLGGSNFDTLNLETVNQVAAALWTGHCSPEERLKKQTACLEALAGIAPKDATEGMLAAQMVACHAAAMECFRRAMIKDQPFDGRQQNLNFANKLTRTFAQHMETLDKHRGKGQQKVTVEHVHVHQGGQAIVGAVTAGGIAGKSEG